MSYTIENNGIFLVCLVVLISVSATANNSDLSSVEREGAEKKMSRMKEILRKRDVDISFYGRVVDQNGEPIVSANVEIQITQFNPDPEKLFGQVKSLVVATDNIGGFSIEEERGRDIYVKNISKSGYEYAMAQNRSSFQYFEESGHPKPFVADKTTPVLFRLRKQGDTAFLLENKYCECQISVNESGKTKGYDFIHQKQIRNLETSVLNGETLTCDLRIKATFNTNNATWIVVLSSGSTNGGIIVSEQLFYEAPKDGYQSEYTFVPEDRKPLKAKYVYLKSREPAIYTRLELDNCNAGKSFFRLNGEIAVTNPYGDRNLEQATDLPYEVTKQLTDEAKTAFRQNKRPQKPDLPKLVKEAKEKADEVKL